MRILRLGNMRRRSEYAVSQNVVEIKQRFEHKTVIETQVTLFRARALLAGKIALSGVGAGSFSKNAMVQA